MTIECIKSDTTDIFGQQDSFYYKISVGTDENRNLGNKLFFYTEPHWDENLTPLGQSTP